jgi:hypothetical protein
MIAGRPTTSSACHRLGDAGGDVEAPVGRFGAVDDGGARVFQPDPVHRLAEQLAVLGHLDGASVGADQLDPELLQHPHIGQRQRRVQPGLPAHGGQQRIGALGLDDLGDHLGRDRLDIGGIGQPGSVMIVAGFELTRMTR